MDTDDEMSHVRRQVGLPDDAWVPEISPCRFDRDDGTFPDNEYELAEQFARLVFSCSGHQANAAGLLYVIRSRRTREQHRIES